MARKGLFSRLRTILGGRNPTPPKPPSAGAGHRGVAMGSRDAPDLASYQQRLQAGREEVPADEVDAFLHGGYPLFVHSTNVAMAQYFPETNQLMVEYLGKKNKGGGAYLYDSVSPAEAESFARAQSKGSWIWSHLRVRGSATAHRKPFRKL